MKGFIERFVKKHEEGIQIWCVIIWLTSCVVVGVYAHIKGYRGFYSAIIAMIVSGIIIGAINYYWTGFWEKYVARRRVAKIRSMNYPHEIEQLVIGRKIRRGFTKDQVAYACGTKPDKIKRDVDRLGAGEEWFYRDSTYYFVNGVLVSWEDDPDPSEHINVELDPTRW